MKAPEERLIELKANLVYLEDTINRLSGTVIEQRKKLDSVGIRLKALIESSAHASETDSNIKLPPGKLPLLILSYSDKADGNEVEQGIRRNKLQDH